MRTIQISLMLVFSLCQTRAIRSAPVLDDSPARTGEWGFHPLEDRPSPTNPPGFVWRPQKDAQSYVLQLSRDEAFSSPDHEIEICSYNCHCPSKPLDPGKWHWRYRFTAESHEVSDWSRSRSFTIDETAPIFPMPSRSDLLKRLPDSHPRLFLRPEDLARYRGLVATTLKPNYETLVLQCEQIVSNPPDSSEPPRYPKEVQSRSEEWKKIWWNNRERTIAALNSAALLGFTHLLGGNDSYAQLARRLVMDCMSWDPKGSTSFSYNDEAGMPFAKYGSRAYTFTQHLLTEEDRQKCREVMGIRGSEIYQSLRSHQLWSPYESHANRAWHFLGEIGVAFTGEIPEAEEWVWFAMNVFFNVYPVWNDDDGGWHEGVSYWRSYMTRFLWWADIMKSAMDIDAFKKPYFSKIGYYPMTLQPPGTRGGGFADLSGTAESSQNRQLMTILASQSGNPYWQWYVEAIGGPDPETGYVGFLRGALPTVEPKIPNDLPTSRCFHGTGLAFLNSNLIDGKNNVSLLFKSSPFGTQSHGYDAQNAFILHAYGERLLISSGWREIHGSEHHRDWMWHTQSVNSITVNGLSQDRHSAKAAGRILDFQTTPTLDLVVGEAGDAYGDALSQFTRTIVYAKPDLILIFDKLKASDDSSFEWWLHAPTPIEVRDQRDIRVIHNEAACRVSFLAPESLAISVTDQFDPPPRPSVKLTEWHLKAQTIEPDKNQIFVVVIRPHRAGGPVLEAASLKRLKAGYAISCPLSGGTLTVLFRTRDKGRLHWRDHETHQDTAAFRLTPAGDCLASLESSPSLKPEQEE